MCVVELSLMLAWASAAQEMFTVYEVLRGAEYGPLSCSHFFLAHERKSANTVHDLKLASTSTYTHFSLVWNRPSNTGA